MPIIGYIKQTDDEGNIHVASAFVSQKTLEQAEIVSIYNPDDLSIPAERYVCIEINSLIVQIKEKDNPELIKTIEEAQAAANRNEFKKSC